jgi:hypothetical protein
MWVIYTLFIDLRKVKGILHFRFTHLPKISDSYRFTHWSKK